MASTNNTGRRAPKPRRPSAAPRSVIKSLDRVERLAGFGISAIGLFLSLVALYQAAVVKKAIITTSKVPHHGKCGAGYIVFKKTCEEVITAGGLWAQFGVITVSLAAMFVFILLRHRYGAIFFAFWSALVLGLFSTGIPFLFFAIWLMVRAWRLQKYGVATFAGVSKVTKARVEARKAGLPEPELPNYAETEEDPRPSRSSRKPAATATTPAPRPTAEPSKRYTPKKSTGKRR